MSKIFSVFVWLPLIFGVSGCSPTLHAVTDATRLLVKDQGNQFNQVVKNPHLRYLKVQMGDQHALMVLGYLDHTEKGELVEVWYSAGGEVLRLQNGLFAGLSGASPEWLNVRFEKPPSWTASDTSHFMRHYDVMPHYRYDIQEKIERRPITCSSLPVHRSDWAELHCYAESNLNSGAPLHAWYIVKQTQVVAGEQCLDVHHCLRWQQPDFNLSPS